MENSGSNKFVVHEIRFCEQRKEIARALSFLKEGLGGNFFSKKFLPSGMQNEGMSRVGVDCLLYLGQLVEVLGEYALSGWGGRDAGVRMGGSTPKC